MHTPLLISVPKMAPTKRERLKAFMAKHQIETNHTPGMERKEHPWLACHMPSARTFGYGVTQESSMFDCVMKVGRLLEESGVLTEGETERDAVERVCNNLKIRFEV